MSNEELRRLETSVRRSKVAQEEARKTLENLDRKNAELFQLREITYQDYTRVMTRASAPSHVVLDENNLPLQLDNITRFANVRMSAPLFTIDETLRARDWIDLLVVLKDLGFSLNTLFEKPLPSVDIAGVSVGEQPVSKAVDNLLYTHTPFKLRGARGNYAILLLPSVRGDSIDRGWFSTEANYFYENGVKVITPDEVRPVLVDQIRDLVYVNGEQFFRFEIDRRIADGAYFCRMGHYISPLRTCNRRQCWLWSACNGTRFWSRSPRSFYSIAKVSPNIEVRVDNYESVERLADFGGILSFEKINELSAKIYIGSVTFMSRYMVRNPMIRLRETIGYRVNTKSISIAIDAPWLKSFVRELLLRDAVLYTWVFTKRFVMDNFDVNDVRQVSTFFWNLIGARRDGTVNAFAKGLRSKSVTEDLVLFGCRLLLHSLSHVMHEEIVARLQTSSDNIVYAYSQKPENDGKYRIFLFENAERGLGLTESFAFQIEKGGQNAIVDMINKITEIQLPCYRSWVSTVSLKDASDEVRAILSHLDSYNRTLMTTYGISVPIEIARYILAREDRETAKLIDREEVSAFIDDILSTSPLCWDGCYQCVRLETDCHEPPYEQMFLVSKHLLVALLNEWRGTFMGGRPGPPTPSTVVPKQPVVEIGEARNLFNYIKHAQKNVKLTSPWISEQVARSICDIAAEKGIIFEILTSLDTQVETHKRALAVFKKSRVRGVQVKVIEEKQLHAKMILVDQSMFIIGSANLTLSGLYENIEGYVVLSNTDVVKESLVKFEDLWNKAVPLEKVDVEE